MHPLPVDRLRVFVSSTIEECAHERQVVRDAITSINHEPVLFEDVGARPYPPREVYQQALGTSQIFIGIYRESYGSIAPGMQISGVEDEFELAATQGKDRLVYIYQTSSPREPRLQTLVDKALSAGITVAFYGDPTELRERIRNDVTAVVSNRFLDQVVVSYEAPQPEEVLSSLVPSVAHRFRRPEVERGLLDTLDRFGRVVVAAPIGSGKTLLLAQLAIDREWVFIDGQGLSPVDMLARAANALRSRLGLPPTTLTTKQSAQEELLRSWESLPQATLAVDGASDPLVFWELPPVDRQLVVTARSLTGIPAVQCFRVPALSEVEIAQWMTGMRGERPSPTELSEVVVQSRGSPLYLRFFCQVQEGVSDLSLQQLEMRSVQALPPRAREITSYLALSYRPMSFRDLCILMGSEDGPEAVAEQVSQAGGLLRQLGDQVTLVHEHLQETILAQLQQDQTRLAFFAGRLGRLFERTRRHLAAFHVYLRAGDDRLADGVVGQAVHQAVLMGGGAPAIPVLRRQGEIAGESGALETRLHALLGLASAYRQTGAVEEAGCALREAGATAELLGQPSHTARVREMEAALNIRNQAREQRITELKALYESCRESGDPFSALRTGLLLGSEYLLGGDYERARRISRENVARSGELGDELGSRISRLHLAASLSETEGGEQEAASIAQELGQEVEPQEHPRERAGLCNYLTRHYRDSGDTQRAAQFALEAIQIGEELKDLFVVAINRINLGNVRRDEGKLEQALIEYGLAEVASKDGGLHEEEAAANELIATVHNDREEYSEALFRAQYAAAQARLAGNQRLVAGAEEQRAIALKGQGDLQEAVAAYVAAASAISEVTPGGTFFAALLGDGLNLCCRADRADLKIELLRGVLLSGSDDPGGPYETLDEALPRLADAVRDVDRVVPLIGLTMGGVLREVAPLVGRRIVLQATRSLIQGSKSWKDGGRLAAVAGVLMVQPRNGSLTLGDTADIAERLADLSPKMYFKPRPEGGGHWTLRLEGGDGVVLSIVQMDQSAKTATTGTVIALLLCGLDSIIREELLDVERLPRTEIAVHLCSRREIESVVQLEQVDVQDLPQGFGILESGDVSGEGPLPIVVVCEDEFPSPWKPDEDVLSDIHMLLAGLLEALVSHLLARRVEPEVLHPKIHRVIREVGCGHR